MSILGLKDFQIRVLYDLSRYLIALKAQKQNNHPDYCSNAWKEISNFLPYSRKSEAQLNYRCIVDGTDTPIPNICLKVPTGGGKTLIGVEAIARINNQYFERNTGLVVWIVPSATIYQQTLKSFKDPDHPYRKLLKLSSEGKLNVIRHTDHLSLIDIESRFTVMLLMLQSSNRKTKETLRMFQDRGGVTDFFPDVDDYSENNRLKKRICNIDVHESTLSKSSEKPLQPLVVKHSLGNVMRTQRPIIVIDEGHKAYSELARDTVRQFNPRFILELSATPDPQKSNILVNVSGSEVKAEEMIKLPINLTNIEGGDWRGTLQEAWEKTQDLYRQSQVIHEENNGFIRPIMLVQVERTGKKQIGGKALHAEDVRNYLLSKFGLRPDEVRVKSSELDEIGQEDLLSEESSVRVVITKQALQEGWDCSFAYVLVLLSQIKAMNALTQLIGRILRQPYAQHSIIEALNQSYVFCHNQTIKVVVKKISDGLKKEGLEDVSSLLNVCDGVVKPKGLSSSQQMSRRNKISIERDILFHILWKNISYSHNDTITVGELEKSHMIETKIEIPNHIDKKKLYAHREIDIEQEIRVEFFVRSLSDIIPNPWQATRIVLETVAALKRRGATSQSIFKNRISLLQNLRLDLQKQVSACCNVESKKY